MVSNNSQYRAKGCHDMTGDLHDDKNKRHQPIVDFGYTIAREMLPLYTMPDGSEPPPRGKRGIAGSFKAWISTVAFGPGPLVLRTVWNIDIDCGPNYRIKFKQGDKEMQLLGVEILGVDDKGRYTFVAQDIQ